MTMPKIVDRVKSAYRLTGFKPVTNVYVDSRRGVAHPLGAIFKAEYIGRKHYAAHEYINKEFNSLYIYGFNTAFSSMRYNTSYGSSDSYRQGYRHGEILRRKLKPTNV